MYDNLTFGLNRRVVVSISLSSFNLFSTELNVLVSCTHSEYEVCSYSIQIGNVVVVLWVGCVCNQS